MQINGIDVTDPTQTFAADKWECLGTAQSYVIQHRTNGRFRPTSSCAKPATNDTRQKRYTVTTTHSERIVAVQHHYQWEYFGTLFAEVPTTVDSRMVLLPGTGLGRQVMPVVHHTVA